MSSLTPCLSVPDECPHVIIFDDADRRPLTFTGSSARKGALKAWEDVSKSWNAHLFVRIASNTRDDSYPSASSADEQVPSRDDLAAMVKRLADEVERLNEVVREAIDDEMDDPVFEHELCDETDDLVAQARTLVGEAPEQDGQ